MGVWHYTNGAGFHGLVTNDVLWATSFRHLNDSREAQYATQLLQAEAKRVRRTLDPAIQKRFDDLMVHAERRNLNLFLLCAARKKNLLTVWRGYGGEIAYAVKLDPDVPLLPVQRTDAEHHPSPPTSHVLDIDEADGEEFVAYDPDHVFVDSEGWLPVRYGARGVKKRVARIADLASQPPSAFNDVFQPWLNLGSNRLLELKNPDFVDERETRMIFDVYPRWKFVQHRDGRYGATPYIQVSAANGENQDDPRDRHLTRPGKLPILAVKLGPTPLGQEAVDATREFLEFNGYPDVPVTKSKIPFR